MALAYIEKLEVNFFSPLIIPYITLNGIQKDIFKELKKLIFSNN